jgi:heme A synthase
MKAIRYLAFVTAGLAYALIVLGAFVRITGSGMGCGDDWPLCNGRLIPPLDDPATLIEYGHRLVAAGLSMMVLALGALALATRGAPGASGPGGTLRPALLAVMLLIAQVFLGAVTVWLELPPTAVVLHLSAALALVATLMVAGLRAGTDVRRDVQTFRAPGRWPILGAAVLAGVVILMGGVTANLGAGPACLGFPLCSGALWPPATESGLSHIHWTHRLLAYGLLVHLIGVALHLKAQRAPDRVRHASLAALGIAAFQIVVAAVMVLEFLPPFWRGLHAAVGTAVWIVLIYLCWLVNQVAGREAVRGERPAAAAHQPL